MINEKKLNESFIGYAVSILGDTKRGLSGKEIVDISNKFAVKFNREIPHPQHPFGEFASEVSNKAEALKNNLNAFNEVEQVEIIGNILGYERFLNDTNALELKEQLYNNYGFLLAEISEREVVAKTIDLLDEYPSSLKLYERALSKYENEENIRNALDDMRLSLELLLRNLLHNKKSLENQIGLIGGYLDKNGVSKESRNMITKIINYYTDFQNDNVKHDNNEKIGKDEAEFIIEITSIIMNFLIKYDGK